ncbi:MULTISPECIES: hypothetical protein [Acidithiobacillus]|nr:MULTISPECIES: hypothetical protein [Acidithiobacillus]MEB8487943.1 hypothetical protein [Acidithiobacillus ferriphilus]MEB8490867.1 hypothetical protein [Acidithiobacillus ferriphilus]MEB8491818.1 hypothetical protein [Acidithiobacillus ferriphilus]MEB8513974.1 hypothetical protein [Acidithiobacillus ferriphilus]MEB8521816.1 hypothetical protein [Acidithiobacillus ferriphilus]
MATGKDVGISSTSLLVLAERRGNRLEAPAGDSSSKMVLNPMQVATVTGHKTLQILKRYTHLRAEDLAKML